MPTDLLPGLRDRSWQIDVAPELIMFLITAVGPRWRRCFPDQPTGRPRADFVDLLFGTLVYLREATTFRRAAARAGVSATTLNDAFHPMTEMIADLGICQADATMLTEDTLGSWCAEMKAHGEIALVDGTHTRCPKPGRSWAAQKPMYDAKHRVHAVNTQTMTTAAGDLLAVHGGWPGSVPEPDQLRHSTFAGAMTTSKVAVVTDAGYRPARGDLGVICRAGNHKSPKSGDGAITLARAENERPNSLLKAWRIMDRIRIQPLTKIHTIVGAVATLVGLRTYGHRHPN